MLKIVQGFCMKQRMFFCLLLASACLLQAMNDSALVTSWRAEDYMGCRLVDDFAAEQVDPVEQAAFDQRLRTLSEEFDARQAQRYNRLRTSVILFEDVPWVVYKKSYKDERRRVRRAYRRCAAYRYYQAYRNNRICNQAEVMRNIRRTMR